MLCLSLRIPVQAFVRTRISYCFNNILVHASVKFYYNLLHFLIFLNIQMRNIETPSVAAYTIYVYLWRIFGTLNISELDIPTTMPSVTQLVMIHPSSHRTLIFIIVFITKSHWSLF
jgi:hypothetical protein